MPGFSLAHMKKTASAFFCYTSIARNDAFIAKTITNSNQLIRTRKVRVDHDLKVLTVQLTLFYRQNLRILFF
jgi:hypothetical protein